MWQECEVKYFSLLKGFINFDNDFTEYNIFFFNQTLPFLVRYPGTE